jgi:hypothetical protein
LRVLPTRKSKWLAATIGLVLVGTAAGVAVASPPFGLTSTIFVTADLQQAVHLNSDKVKFQTKGPTDVRVQRLDFAAGAYSGWHHHPGMARAFPLAQSSSRAATSRCRLRVRRERRST